MGRLLRGLAGRLPALVLICALCPASAAAAKKPAPSRPFTLDASPAAAKPTIAVDAEGAAHVAWTLKGPGTGDDAIGYCRVPRGKRACTGRQTLSAPLEAFAPPHVLLPGDGRVLIVSSRCCVTAPGNPTYLLASADGGTTFSAPLQVGTNEASDAELGPGGFSVSTISDVTTGGVTFQVAPLSGPPPPKFINLGEIPGNVVGGAYSGSIAFVDPQTPIVAMDDLETVYFRLFGGGTAYNDAGAWGPPTPVAAGDEPMLAGLPSGKKGVHLLYRAGTPGKFRLVARRYKGASSFGPAAPVSERGDPIFHFFFMDGGGRLHAVWVNNEEDSLSHRVQPSGKGWGAIETLLGKRRAGNVYSTRAAAAKDGGGFVVWDANNAGPVRAVAFGPSGSPKGGKGGSACVDELEVGGATVTAQEGCLRQDPKKKSRYTTVGDVRVNGIDILLGGAARASATASAAPKLTIETGPRTLVSSGKVEAKVGNVVLGRQVLQWRLPAGKGEVRDLAGNPAELDTGKFKVALLGLRIVGYTVPRIDGTEKVEIPVNLNLPAPFDSVLGKQATGSATLRATNEGGLTLSGFKVHIENVSLGIAQVKTFDIHYVADPNLLQGDTDILLPPVGADLGAAFGLMNGDFDYGRGEFTFPPGQLAVATNVLLRKIEFEVEKAKSCGKPTRIAGGVTLATGPEVAGTSLIAVDGTVSYSFPRSSCGTPGILDVEGAGKLAGFPVANLKSRFTTDGQLTFETSVDFSVAVASATVSLEGGVDIPSQTFYASGKGSVAAFGYAIAQADAIVSSVGVAVCAPVAPLLEMGFEYAWGESLGSDNFDAPPDCDIDMGAYKPAPFSRPWLARGPAALSAAGPSAAGRFSLPKGLRSATVRVDGAGAAPGLTLKGPGGLSVSYPSAAAGAVSGKGFAVVPVGTQTFVRIQSPAAGAYTVEGAGGPTVTGVAVARGLPEPEVTGRVRRGRGRGRTLSFEARPVKGQKVIFVEQGPGVRNVLAATAQRRGVIHFQPALGPAGRRRVLAIVTQGGAPRAEVAVARFVAPRSLPGRPLGVSVRRAGRRLVVRWRRAPRAHRVAVSWALADGRRLAEIVKGHRLVIPNVPGIDSGLIRVAGLRRDNVAGKPATLRLKAKPKRRPPRRRR